MADGIAGRRITSKMSFSMVIMVLLALQRPEPLSARFMVWNSTTVTERATMETGAVTFEPVAIDLMQYHHVDSPYATKDLNLAQRVQIAVKSSVQREQYFHAQISKAVSFGTTDVYTSPVYSDAQGSYIMQISIGTPVKTFVAIADTGSDLVWVQCNPCTTCFPQPDPIFNPSASSSYQTISCSNNALCSALPSESCSASRTCLYQYDYLDNSATSGDLAYENFTFTTTSGSKRTYSNFGFGCGHNNTGMFGATDGLVGLGRGTLSLVSQLGSYINHLFSYCLVDFYSSTTKTSPLLLGSAGSGTLSYTPLVSNPASPSFYYVNLTGITVDGFPISYPSGTFSIDTNGNGGLILDSGTTWTLMNTQAYNPFKACMASLISYPTVDNSDSGLDLCYNVSGIRNPTFPSVVFQFEGVDVALPDNNIFLQVDNTICFAFLGSNSSISIYGNFQQQNFQIAYDLGNGRVGFRPTTC